VNKSNGYLKIGLFLFFATSVVGCKNNNDKIIEEKRDQRPNILFIMADDLGFSDLGAFGSEISTPNLDTLAQEGRILTNFHSAAACSPTRAELLSGADHHPVGLGEMSETLAALPVLQGKPGYDGYLNDKSLFLPEILKDHGYHTYMAGKWHLGLTAQTSPQARGFERSFALLEGMDLHFKASTPELARGSTYKEDSVSVTLPANFYSTNFYTDKLIEYIEHNKKDEKPFFAYAAYTAPHWPIQAPNEFIARNQGKYDSGYEIIRKNRFEQQKKLGIIPQDFEIPDFLPANQLTDKAPLWSELTAEQRKIEARKMEVYAGMVENLDYNIGRLISYLKQNNLYDNTLIFFVSDNGPQAIEIDQRPQYNNSYENIGHADSYVQIGSRWAEVSATPFQLFKHTAGEGASSVPAIVRLPHQYKKVQQSSEFVSIRDILPTVLDFADIQRPTTEYKNRQVIPISGLSWKEFLAGKQSSVRGNTFFFGDELHGNKYIRNKEWKLRYQVYPLSMGTGAWELFDLKTDRSERKNVVSQNPEIVKQLIDEYNVYAQKNGVVDLTAIYSSDK